MNALAKGDCLPRIVHPADGFWSEVSRDVRASTPASRSHLQDLSALEVDSPRNPIVKLNAMAVRLIFGSQRQLRAGRTFFGVTVVKEGYLRRLESVRENVVPCLP